MDTDSRPRSNVILKVLLEGLYDEDCPLSRLRGCCHILRAIWAEVRRYWVAAIQLPCAAPEEEPRVRPRFRLDLHVSRTFVSPVSSVRNYGNSYETAEAGPEFPAPTGININMMPFIVGETFEDCRLPELVRPYWQLIRQCVEPQSHREHHHIWDRRRHPSDLGRVYYLTIQETEVAGGEAQRRPGLHVDSPGSVNIRGGAAEAAGAWRGRGTSHLYTGHRWGAGSCHVFNVEKGESKDFWDIMAQDSDHLYAAFGGIYLASSVAASCRVWNCGVAPEAVGSLGDIEHLRWALPGPGQLLRPGQLYWVTDRTPHESLPLQEAATRQFFRVVTAEVSLWYRDHSTASPLGVLPDPALTRIVAGDKFSEAGLQLVTGWEEAASEQMEEERRKLKLWNQARCDFHKSYPGSKECDVCKKRFQFMKDV